MKVSSVFVCSSPLISLNSQVFHFKPQLCFSHPLIIQHGAGAPGGGGGSRARVCVRVRAAASGLQAAERLGVLELRGSLGTSSPLQYGWMEPLSGHTHTLTHSHSDRPTNKVGTHTNTHICLHNHACILSFALFGSHFLSQSHAHKYTHALTNTQNSHTFKHTPFCCPLVVVSLGTRANRVH